MFSPPLQGALVGRTGPLFVDQRVQRIKAGLTQPIRQSTTDVELAWVRTLLEFAQQPELVGDGWLMRWLLAAGDEAGADVLAHGFDGLHRFVVPMLLGEPLDQVNPIETTA